MNRSVVRAFGCGLLFLNAFALWLSVDSRRAIAQEVTAEGKVAVTIPPASSSIFCLKTEPMPPGYDANTRPDRLARELGRQAILIAARDELGLATRDETLEETFPAELVEARRVMNAAPRAKLTGGLQLALWAGTGTMQAARRGRGTPDAGPRPWSTELKITATSYDLYLSIAAALEPFSRKELPDALRGFGYDGKVKEANPANLPPASMEKLLAELNYVSSFLAVRAAHSAIAEEGESQEWLSVLVRGYANLSLLTVHHLTSATDAFAARSLLYAERLVNQRPNDPLSYANRAYARCLLSLHGAALADVKKIAELRELANDKSDLPSWSTVVEPFCSFQREKFDALAKSHSDCAQLFARFGFEFTRSYEVPLWTDKASEPVMQACTEDYGVYSLVSNETLSNEVFQNISKWAIALAARLPQRIRESPAIPQLVRDVAQGNTAALPDAVPALGATNRFSAVPTNIARALLAVAKDDSDHSEPSWAVLGKLVEEEQFALVSTSFGAGMGSLPGNEEGDVEAVWPIIGEHRYSWMIKSFTPELRRDTNKFYEFMKVASFTDPRSSMYRLFWQAWYVEVNARNNGRGLLASWQTFLNVSLTQDDIMAMVDQRHNNLLTYMTKQHQEKLADDLAAISPYSPHTLRMRLQLMNKPSAEQLAEWEQKAGDDANAFRLFGLNYESINHPDDAIRCFERSLAMFDNYHVYISLAEAYRKNGQPELWLPTLERFFQAPDTEGEHFQMRQKIANDLVMRREYEQAEQQVMRISHTSAGQTLAADLYEGMNRWEESEKWVRELATSEPEYYAIDWYDWCKRTGRGDLTAAQALVEKVRTEEWFMERLDRSLLGTIYYQLHGEPRAALVHAKRHVEKADALAPDEKIYCWVHLAILAKELNEQETLQKSLEVMRTSLTKDREALGRPDKDFPEVLDLFCDLLDGKPIDVATAEATMAKTERMTVDHWRNYSYLVGRALELRGDIEAADKLYRPLLLEPPFDKHCRNLAGMRLAARLGTSRP